MVTEDLRDELLGQLAAALPVDAVVLGLHGAMVAQQTDDCEGDLMARARDLAGPDAIISAEMDPQWSRSHGRSHTRLSSPLSCLDPSDFK